MPAKKANDADDDARTRLINGTRELLWERGYAATSPSAIMRRAGVGQGSMYHHFAGKEDLAAAAFADAADHTVERAEKVLNGPGSAPDRLRGYLLRQRDVLRGCPIGRMAQDPEVLASDPLNELLHNAFQRIREQVTAVVGQGQRAGEFPDDLNAAELADMVLAVVQGGYVLARAQGRPAPFNRAVRGAAALIGIAAADPPTAAAAPGASTDDPTASVDHRRRPAESVDHRRPSAAARPPTEADRSEN
ncbi:TetR/AcrR family transcriptional regulator [Nakamurella lactea]|uniref:TetR/AcrR family transcriptional regulator n=1 Tax=Nakamurella lactea TaxID=459515 RepID=UPI0003FB24C0|nr:TetR/AcrR family transcriptional regulator [Nakamurella lactea]